MKRYFLTIITNGISTERLRKITEAIFELIDNEEIKHVYLNDIIMFNFESEIDRIEIYDYLDVVLEEEIKGFILNEIDDTSVRLPDDVYEFLFEDTKDDIDENIDDNIVSRILHNIKKITTKPSLDAILEKIKLSGVNSLTPYEKETLNDYSKN